MEEAPAAEADEEKEEPRFYNGGKKAKAKAKAKADDEEEEAEAEEVRRRARCERPRIASSAGGCGRDCATGCLCSVQQAAPSPGQAALSLGRELTKRLDNQDDQAAPTTPYASVLSPTMRGTRGKLDKDDGVRASDNLCLLTRLSTYVLTYLSYLRAHLPFGRRRCCRPCSSGWLRRGRSMGCLRWSTA